MTPCFILKPTNDQLGRIYRTSARQIARWKTAKAPLLDVPAMMLWFSTRADMPDHLRHLSDEDQAAMQSQIDSLRGEAVPSVVEPKKNGRKIPEPLQGAQHALRRLEEEEARLYREMAEEDSLLKQASTRKQWLEVSTRLKQFDMLVEAGRRDSGETITRAQMQPVLTATTVWLRRGVEGFLNSVCKELAEAQRPEDIYERIGERVRLSVGNAVDAATGDGKIPGWVREALVSGL